MIHPLPWPVALCIIAWLLNPVPAIAQDVHARSLVTATEIIEAMQNHQLPTSGVQIRLSVPITSAVAHPSLNIQAIAPLNKHDVRLRMACQDSSLCLPFFATATFAEAIDPGVFGMKLDLPPSASSKFLPAATAAPENPASSTLHRPLKPVEPPMLRSGSLATLDFDAERVHVRVEVICLESGAPGDKIRVTTRDRRQVYVAEIVAPNALKGTLTR